MNAGASLSAVPSPIEGSGTAWVLLGSWALSPARPTPIPPRHECRGFSALLGDAVCQVGRVEHQATLVSRTGRRDGGHLQLPQFDQGPVRGPQGGDVVRRIALCGQLQEEA